MGEGYQVILLINFDQSIDSDMEETKRQDAPLSFKIILLGNSSKQMISKTWEKQLLFDSTSTTVSPRTPNPHVV